MSLIHHNSQNVVLENLIVANISRHGIIKGILHPKMRILSFTRPQVVATLYEFLSSDEHKGRYFKERLAPLTSVPIVLQNIFIFGWSIPLKNSEHIFLFKNDSSAVHVSKKSLT